MPSFEEFVDALSKRLELLAAETWKEHREAAIADGVAFVERRREDLRRWTQQLARGDLSREEFVFLVGAKRDVARMTALERAGLALAGREKFRRAVVDTVVGTAFDVFL